MKEITGKSKFKIKKLQHRIVTDEKTIAEKFNHFFGKYWTKSSFKNTSIKYIFWTICDVWRHKPWKERTLRWRTKKWFFFTKNSPGPVDIYLLKVNNRNTRTRSEICSKLTIKTPERRHCMCYSDFWKPWWVLIFTTYRPISVFLCFSKILERIIYNRVYDFLSENNILTVWFSLHIQMNMQSYKFLAKYLTLLMESNLH